MNFDRWKHLRDTNNPPHCMDWRHVCMINAVLRGERPRSVVSFGCHRGFSDSAVFEALEEQSEIETADFFDPDMQPEMMERHAPPRVVIHKAPSGTYIGNANCWLIDGDHWAGAGADYKAARAANADIIVIHDTHSAYTMGGHHGSRDIGGFLQIEAPWQFLDARLRDGEMTQRGLLVGFFKKPQIETMEALERLCVISRESLL